MHKTYTKNEILTELTNLINISKLTEQELENTLDNLMINLKTKKILSQETFSDEDILFFIAYFHKFLDFSIKQSHPIFTALTNFLTQHNFMVKLKPHPSATYLYYEDEQRRWDYVFSYHFKTKESVQKLLDKTDTIYINTYGIK